MPLVQEPFGDIITFTRASTGTFFNSAGVLTSAAINAPRFDYNPTTLAARGFLIEEARTNLLLQSADFATTWVTGFTTIAANTTASPDGGTNGDKLQETAVTNEHYVRQFLTGLTTNTTYTVSVFVKASERTRFRIRILDTDNVSNGYSADYNLTTVAANGSGIGAGSITGTPSITSVGNGWFRCVVSGNASTGTKYIVDFFLLNAAGAVNYLGVAGEGLFLWGAQCELGSFSTSYIPTTVAQVTRSADVASVNTLSPWYNATAGTLFAEASRQTAGATAGVLTGFAQAATFNQSMYMSNDVGTGNSLAMNIINGGVSQAGVGGPVSPAITSNFKAAFAYEANNFAGSINGGTPVTDTSGTVPGSIGVFAIGNAPWGIGSTVWSGYLRRIVYYPRRLSNTELQALTA